jgi:hypothetical protein
LWSIIWLCVWRYFSFSFFVWLFVCLGCDLLTIRIFSCTLSWRNAWINLTTNWNSWHFILWI